MPRRGATSGRMNSLSDYHDGDGGSRRRRGQRNQQMRTSITAMNRLNSDDATALAAVSRCLDVMRCDAIRTCLTSKWATQFC
mmetsp:Transcript_8939/g.25709  ORF Transcript_8939/g.25709 Transcript_8939/m.25709 type:complete len:82 (+) Transcript_8939:119-364(+)